MTVQEAIEKIREVGELDLMPDGNIRYRLPASASSRLSVAIEFLKSRKPEAVATVQMESVLKGQAIELWCDAVGEKLWLVADEEDARRLGEDRGAVYTVGEARRVVAIGDPDIVAQVHRWKRRFDARLADIKQYK